MVKAAHNPPTNREPYTVEYAYDHQGRMVWKQVSANAVVLSTRGLVWDGWNIVQETVAIGNQQSAVTNSFVWGLDIAEQSGAGLPRHSAPGASAGGVGGLLAVTTSSPDQPNSLTTYYPSCDANGNVTEYADDSGTIAAHYEYDPFGNTVVQSGDLADSFTHRFSTKPWCPVTGLSEYLFRKYSPGMGRWLNRDLIEERGGLNLYGMLSNQPSGQVDNLGLSRPFNSYAFLDKLRIVINKTKTAIREAKDCLRMLNHWRNGGDEQATDDKYRHCLASCEINGSCGTAIARATGYLKEAYDLFRGYLQVSAEYLLPIDIAVELDLLIQGGDFKDSVEDFTADEIGIKCAKSPDGCTKCCCGVYAP